MSPCGHHAHMRRQVLSDFINKERVVRAPEYEGVDVGVLVQQRRDVALHEVVGALAFGFKVLYQRYPHGAGVRVEA